MTNNVEEKRVALVTGGIKGIGRGIATCLARDGYNLVLGYNSDAETAAKVQQDLQQQHGVAVEVVGGDVALVDTWDALFDCVRQRFGGRLTAFVNNAGLFIGRSSFSDAQPDISGADGWEAAFSYYHDVYVKGFKRGLTRALAYEGFRHAVAISAQGCNNNSGPSVMYEQQGQAKAAMEWLVRVNALALAGKGINVNAVVPGYISSNAWDKLISKPEQKARLDGAVADTPAGRWGVPEEVGELVAFLCSPRASFLTGASIPVDGGLHLTRKF